MLLDSLLWEISGDSIDRSSFIFGTIHLQCSAAQDFIVWLEKIMDQVDIVYTEAALDQPVSASHYQISDGRTLSDLIGEKKYIKIRKIFQKAFDFDLDQNDRLLPLLLSQNLGLISQSVEHQPSLDSQIYLLAIGSGKEYKGIESMEEQLAILEKISMDYQLKSLLKIASNVKNFRKSLRYLVDLYENQRIAQLYKSSRKHLGPIRNLLLYERNHVIADRIAEFHQDRPSLFTFGAGHLAGNKGVLALLKRKGLTPKANFQC